jgi:hypothetical protein
MTVDAVGEKLLDFLHSAEKMLKYWTFDSQTCFNALIKLHVVVCA